MKDSPPRHGSPLVLVVDDDPAVRGVVSAFLETTRCKVLTAADGLEAVQVYCDEGHPLSLLVTDINMPRMDGITLARRLVDIQPALRVVYMSGESEIVTNRVSGSIWLRKPFSGGTLLTKVRELLPCA